MSTEHTIAHGKGDEDWFINRDLYGKNELILYTSQCEPAMLLGEFAVVLTAQMINAIKES